MSKLTKKVLWLLMVIIVSAFALTLIPSLFDSSWSVIIGFWIGIVYTILLDLGRHIIKD